MEVTVQHLDFLALILPAFLKSAIPFKDLWDTLKWQLVSFSLWSHPSKCLKGRVHCLVSHSKMAHQASYYLRTTSGYAPFCHIQRKHIKVLRNTRYREFIHQHRHRFNYVWTRESISHSSQNPPEVYSGTHSHVLEWKEMPLALLPSWYSSYFLPSLIVSFLSSKSLLSSRKAERSQTRVQAGWSRLLKP